MSLGYAWQSYELSIIIISCRYYKIVGTLKNIFLHALVWLNNTDRWNVVVTVGIIIIIIKKKHVIYYYNRRLESIVPSHLFILGHRYINYSWRTRGVSPMLLYVIFFIHNILYVTFFFYSKSIYINLMFQNIILYLWATLYQNRWRYAFSSYLFLN